MKKFLKWAGISLLALVLIGSLGFVIWAENASGPGSAALAALKSDSQVEVNDNGKYITFTPVGTTPEKGFIFYPGGKVEYRSYAPILHKIAEQGIFVALVPVRLNLAFFDINAAEPVLRDYPNIPVWAVGGHSLGGVAASIFAQSQPVVRGIVFWASYPADDKLKTSGIKMISIYGTNDGLATGEKIEQYKRLEPADTQFVPIEGGNHAQFGDYGLQSGDNAATIPAEEQWQKAAAATVEFIQSLQP